MKFRAAILEAINAPLAVDEIEAPLPGYGQVFVRVRVSGICGAQLQEIAGHKGNAGYVPHLLGHEGCGIVERIGPGVTTVKVGDKVVMHWRKGAGIESDTPQYQRSGGGTVGGGRVTTFTEFAVVSENRVTTVPPETPDELCALLGCSLSTALGVIENDAAVKFGENVMVVGIGGLGGSLLRAARLAHAGMIVAADCVPKPDLALRLGADVFVITPEKLPAGFDVIIDTSGSPEAIARTLPLLRESGRYILVGQPKPGAAVSIEAANHLFGGTGKTIKATQGGGFNPAADLARYVRLHVNGVLKLDHLITKRVKLEDINEAIDLVRSGQAGRILIEMNHES